MLFEMYFLLTSKSYSTKIVLLTILVMFSRTLIITLIGIRLPPFPGASTISALSDIYHGSTVNENGLSWNMLLISFPLGRL